MEVGLTDRVRTVANPTVAPTQNQSITHFDGVIMLTSSSPMRGSFAAGRQLIRAARHPTCGISVSEKDELIADFHHGDHC